MASTTKFTEKAQEAILNAQRETESRNISSSSRLRCFSLCLMNLTVWFPRP